MLSHGKNPNRFFMSKAIAPELIVAADIMEFDLDSKPIDARGREGYMERFIHSEIFRARPEVNAVVHAHTAGKPLPLLPDPKGGTGYGRGWDAWIKEEARLVK